MANRQRNQQIATDEKRAKLANFPVVLRWFCPIHGVYACFHVLAHTQPRRNQRAEKLPRSVKPQDREQERVRATENQPMRRETVRQSEYQAMRPYREKWQ